LAGALVALVILDLAESEARGECRGSIPERRKDGYCRSTDMAIALGEAGSGSGRRILACTAA